MPTSKKEEGRFCGTCRHWNNQCGATEKMGKCGYPIPILPVAYRQTLSTWMHHLDGGGCSCFEEKS